MPIAMTEADFAAFALLLYAFYATSKRERDKRLGTTRTWFRMDPRRFR